MNSSTTTVERAFGTAVGIRNPGLWGAPAVTNQSVRVLQFRMTEGVSIAIEFEGTEPDWLVSWMERLSRLLNLPEGWDSYEASRIKPSAIIGAINFLLPAVQDLSIPVPDAIPHRSGGVQLEWHVGETDLEVLALSEHQYRISYSKQGVEITDDLVTKNPHLAVVAVRELSLSS